ncbi:MAG: hypothetical protein AAFX02_07745, partial [Pseudomonadota bacterium]
HNQAIAEIDTEIDQTIDPINSRRPSETRGPEYFSRKPRAVAIMTETPDILPTLLLRVFQFG